MQIPQGPLPPAQVMAYLEAQGIFKSADDPLRTYMVQDGKVTPMGEAAFRYFVARPKDVKSFTQELDKLRESGPLDDKKAEQIQQALQQFTQQFGDIGSGGSNEDAFSLGAKLHSLLTGAAEQRASSGELSGGSAGYVQVDRGDAFEFHDKDGLLIKTTKPRLTPEGDRKVREVMAKLGQALPDGQEIDVPSAVAILQAAGEISGPEDPRAKQYYSEGGMQTWNRQIEQQQRAMNESRPPNAPPVPVNGRYNKEMFDWSYWAMRQQVEETKLQLKVDRMARLAELLGKQFKDDQWYKDPKLEQQLMDEARKKTFSQLWIASRGPQFDAACGRKVANYLDLVECKLKNRVEVVRLLEERLAAYENRVGQFKDVNIISQDQFVSVQRGELMVRKFVTLAWIEGQRWRADAQLERLDFSAPDHEALKKTIDEAPLSAEEKRAYERRGLELVDRIQRLKRSYAALQNTLTTADFATALDRVQGTLAQTQKELGDAELDFRLYASMPGMAKTAK
ncbi:MAG: hypothetical protein HY925_16875, partial [Elusimicrobia bacterium]|nr:hypothetical protein [Elusimicrobiota bacterium]